MNLGLVRDLNENICFDDFNKIPAALFTSLTEKDRAYCMKKMTVEGKTAMAELLKQAKRPIFGEVVYNFTALETFFCKVMCTEYVEGLSYGVREGNDKLHNQAQIWKNKKKIEVT